MGSGLVVDWIDWVRAPGELPADRAPAAFFRLPYAGRWYLWSVFGVWPVLPPGSWYDEFWDDEIWWLRVVGPPRNRPADLPGAYPEIYR
jgi:hypothetical protein